LDSPEIEQFWWPICGPPVGGPIRLSATLSLRSKYASPLWHYAHPIWILPLPIPQKEWDGDGPGIGQGIGPNYGGHNELGSSAGKWQDKRANLLNLKKAKCLSHRLVLSFEFECWEQFGRGNVGIWAGKGCQPISGFYFL
jgi:hypothetical protein